jgi:solute carrier family 35 protein F5
VCLIPVFPLLHWLGWETFELPPTRDAWTICLINMCITLSSDYLYVLGECRGVDADPDQS